jgi:mono/diheme cytochrome c family protein
MRYGRFARYAGLLAISLSLAACNSGSNTGDVFPGAALAITPTSGPDSFLLFPNPQKQADGTLQTDTAAYATAYYAAIDPNNNEDTLDKWKAANGFGDLTTGTETTVVFGDVRDLGYGRRMTARNITSGPNAGTIAVMVENYLVSPGTGYAYSSFNLDAAVVRDPRWHVGTNAIEFSGSTCINATPPMTDPATCDPTIKFAKFYTFNPTTGQRLFVADLDGRGDKAMPGICITCHGGRGDPLTPALGSPTNLPLFPWVGNSASQKRGDVQAHMQPLIVDSFGYSATPGYTRADQEAKLKTINQMVLSSYPMMPSDVCSPTCTEDANRRVIATVNINEWGGSAAKIIKAAYGGPNLPSPTFSDTYVPTGWQTPAISVDQTSLYKTVVAPYCRTCHIQRGTWYMDGLNFDNYCSEATLGTCDSDSVNPYNSYFYGYASRIKAHVIDRGNMPLAKIVYERFWGSNDPDTLAAFLQGAQTQAVKDSSGAALKPGRPVADPGPDRTTDSPATLSAANSLYATTYTWSVVSGTGTLTNANSAQAMLTGPPGPNVVQLVVGNGTAQSNPVKVNITIDTAGSVALPKAAGLIRFADIKAILQGSGGCTGCHYSGGGPPIYYVDYDRNGDSAVDTTDDQWFYTELRGRINFTDVAASPLLRKPTGHHHGGGPMLNTTDPSYNMILLWILNGAPY